MFDDQVPSRANDPAPEQSSGDAPQCAQTAYGGSANTRSNGPRRDPEIAAARPFPRSPWQATHPRSCAGSARDTPQPPARASTNVAWAAPRLRASMPRLPLPANRSSTRAPSNAIRLASMLKIVAAPGRWPAGRRGRCTVRIVRPLYNPVMTRMAQSLRRATPTAAANRYDGTVRCSASRRESDTLMCRSGFSASTRMGEPRRIG